MYRVWSQGLIILLVMLWLPHIFDKIDHYLVWGQGLWGVSQLYMPKDCFSETALLNLMFLPMPCVHNNLPVPQSKAEIVILWRLSNCYCTDCPTPCTRQTSTQKPRVRSLIQRLPLAWGTQMALKPNHWITQENHWWIASLRTKQISIHGRPYTHSQYLCKFGTGSFRKIGMFRFFFEISYLLDRWRSGSETEILSHNYFQSLHGASLSMPILTRKYELCNVCDWNQPHNKIDTTKISLTSHEWALVQIVIHFSFDTYVIIATKHANSSSHGDWQQYLLYLAHSNFIDYDFNMFFSNSCDII